MPHYGLRYGSAPATGNLQRLRGRPPLVNPLKVVYGPFFHGGNTGSNPVGDANKIKGLRCSQRAARVAGNATVTIEKAGGAGTERYEIMLRRPLSPFCKAPFC
jgi:hypothetical protein